MTSTHTDTERKAEGSELVSLANPLIRLGCPSASVRSPRSDGTQAAAAQEKPPLSSF